jgi:hypothetical protein
MKLDLRTADACTVTPLALLWRESALIIGIEHVTRPTKRLASINLSPDENNRSAATYPSSVSSDRCLAGPRNVAVCPRRSDDTEAG